MKNPILSLVWQRTRVVLTKFSFSLVAVSFCMAAAQGQEKALESNRAPGWVVIPVEEYRVLRAKAYPTEREPEPPPVEATLSRVDYDLHVTGDLATGSASLTVDVLKDGWVRVPVPAGLLVREARLEGKLVSLVPASEGKDAKEKAHLAALLSHAGRWTLLLDLDVPVNSSAGEESVSLPAGESGVTRVAMQVPRQGIDLRLGGGLLSDKSETSGETKWLAYGHGNEPLTFTWRRKTEDHHLDLPLRLRGSLTQLTSLGEDSTAIYAEAALEVLQGAAREVKIALPATVTVNQVTGAMVADWEMKNGELAVSFLEPVENSVRFVISGETRLPRDGLVDIPLLYLLNTERQEGGVAVEILGAGEIKGEKSQGLEEADATDLGETIAGRQSPALVAFRYRAGSAGTGRTLSINLARYDQQAVLMANVEEARYQVLLSADGKQLVQARYAIRNNQRNFVKVTLPANSTVWSVCLDGKPVRPGQAPDGSMLLPLEKSRGGEDPLPFPVEIFYLTKASPWQDKGHEKLALPALDLPISRTGLLLYYPPLFRISPESGMFRTEQYQYPDSALVALNTGVFGGIGTGYGGAPGTSMSAPVPAAPKEFDKLEQFSQLRSADDKEKKDATQALLDTFRAKSLAGKVTGILPVSVAFPAFGPSIFMVSELTSENQSPIADFSFQREKKGGVR